ncbi:class I SAM-dependent methyltransferase [Xylanimonas oleitrophica]|uniref:Class I SAM-dependent methyltransferase n=1 Tax=Xylanimonas oleitrophica TaxID=2607479 RepID=A0A2W5WZ36_9MICO|nr:class I SAM-dependent methyltransferase [Xylanimonas oleitrophica]PZR53135.1 class I SAM-dependent methyltransferase [Xylanimonas oleitrophica]
MSAVTPSDAVERLIERWDEQQAAYITHREQRFAVMLDVIAHLCTTTDTFAADGTGLTVLDLACGPGSLSGRVLDRFPGARVVGLDYDPVLLTLARRWLGDRHGDRFTGLDADLATKGWETALPPGPVHVAVSSTALHWLEPAQLVDVYMALGDLLPSDGVLMNADHLRYDTHTQPFMTQVAAADDARTQRTAHGQGVPTWDEWWAEATQLPELAHHLPERERRFADRPPTPHAPLELHLDALRTGGFRETGTVWRYYDDVVVLARR